MRNTVPFEGEGLNPHPPALQDSFDRRSREIVSALKRGALLLSLATLGGLRLVLRKRRNG
jgi:hypothetical protein